MDADIEGDEYGEGRGIQGRGPGPPKSWLRPKRAPNKEEKTEIFNWAKQYFWSRKNLPFRGNTSWVWVKQRLCLRRRVLHYNLWELILFWNWNVFIQICITHKKNDWWLSPFLIILVFQTWDGFPADSGTSNRPLLHYHSHSWSGLLIN